MKLHLERVSFNEKKDGSCRKMFNLTVIIKITESNLWKENILPLRL